MLVGQEQQIKILVGLDEFVHHKQRVVRRHVVVQRPVRKQQMSLQVFCKVLIGLVIIVGSPVGVFYQQSLIPFAPVIFVLAIVMVAGFRDSHFEKIGIAKHGVR